MMELIQGTFISESKRRFLCTVRVEEQDVLCYVPASCHLSPLIELEGRTVLLTPVESSKARTQFALFAVKHGRSFVLLNLAYANKVVEKEFHRRLFAFLGKRKAISHESVIDGYKSDLYIHDTDTLIEIKTVLSMNKEVEFPSMATNRAVKQLKEISHLIDCGHRIAYFVISLNPAAEAIVLDPQYEEFYSAFKECTDKGMLCCAFSIRLKDGVPLIHKRLPLRT